MRSSRKDISEVHAPAPAVSGARYDWTKTHAPEQPWLIDYDRTLVMKIFLASKADGGMGCTVHLNFEEALDVIRRLDVITCGVPKVVYLVGWQFNGHDSKYPALSEVNARLKWKDDATAVESLRWLIRAGRRYNTTISLHINMLADWNGVQRVRLQVIAPGGSSVRDAGSGMVIGGKLRLSLKPCEVLLVTEAGPKQLLPKDANQGGSENGGADRNRRTDPRKRSLRRQ